jgi:hypothetical protein
LPEVETRLGKRGVNVDREPNLSFAGAL